MNVGNKNSVGRRTAGLVDMGFDTAQARVAASMYNTVSSAAEYLMSLSNVPDSAVEYLKNLSNVADSPYINITSLETDVDITSDDSSMDVDSSDAFSESEGDSDGDWLDDDEKNLDGGDLVDGEVTWHKVLRDVKKNYSTYTKSSSSVTENNETSDGIVTASVNGTGLSGSGNEDVSGNVIVTENNETSDGMVTASVSGTEDVGGNEGDIQAIENIKRSVHRKLEIGFELVLKECHDPVHVLESMCQLLRLVTCRLGKVPGNVLSVKTLKCELEQSEKRLFRLKSIFVDSKEGGVEWSEEWSVGAVLGYSVSFRNTVSDCVVNAIANRNICNKFKM